MKNASILLLASLFLFACSSNETDGSEELDQETISFQIPESFKPKKEVIQINTSIENTILLSDGSSLFIPPYAIENESGDTNLGTVDLEYTLYANSADIAFSGIPMHPNPAEQNEAFNSAGMFSIQAKDSSLKVRSNKHLVMDFKLSNQVDDMNFFALSEDSSGWSQIQDIPNEQVTKAALPQQTEPLHAPDIPEQQFDVAILSAEVAFDTGNVIFQNAVDLAIKGNVDIDSLAAAVNAPPKVKQAKNRDATLLASGANAGHTYPPIIAGLNIPSFGVYNCDQIYRIKDLITLQVKFVDAQGIEIQDQHVLSVIDLNYNGAFSWDPRYAFSASGIGDVVLALFTKKGKIYLLERGEWKKLMKNRSTLSSITLKDHTENIRSSKELAEYLGIEM